eukprot:Em1336g1a
MSLVQTHQMQWICIFIGWTPNLPQCPQKSSKGYFAGPFTLSVAPEGLLLLCKESCDVAAEGPCALNSTMRSLLLSNCGGPMSLAGDLPQCFQLPSGVFNEVEEFCRSSPTCQKTSQLRVRRAPLILLPIISEPFSWIAMDIVGPLPRSRSGNRYVLVICDYATRYPEAIPLRSIDDGYRGASTQEQDKSYHPQTDGLVERFNKTLKEIEVPQSSTGFSPFELLYGQDVRGPLDVLKETEEE